MSSQQLLEGGQSTGGLTAIPFILANAALERMSSHGLLANMILYLMGDYGMEMAKGTNVILFWTSAINFMPLIGAFVADSYLGRFLTIGLGSITTFMGTVLLWLTAMIPQAKPPHCPESYTCASASSKGQLALLFSSFAMIALGSGGVRPCSLAFGADQLEKRDDKHVLESYFGWYYASVTVSVLISFTAIVYTQDHFGWKIGFGVPAVLMFLSTCLFFVGSSIYVKHNAFSSLLVNFAQVVVACFRKRKLPMPTAMSGDQLYHHEKGSKISVPTDQLRLLNKACIMTSYEMEMASDASALDPWKTCTVEQVEQLKALLKVMPIWSTGIMLSLNISQNTFLIQQANSMDRHIIRSSFQIPAGSFSMFSNISIIIWIILFYRVIIPLASNICGKPVRVGVRLRMGIGLFMSFISMVVSVIVEQIRRSSAIERKVLHNATQVVTMSAMWLIPQCSLLGLAEAFNFIGQTEFYYSELPKSMSSIAASLCTLGMAVANLLASALLSLVDCMTSKNGNTSWVSTNINKGHYDSYYSVLATLSLANLIYFLVCSWAYGPCLGYLMKDEGLHMEEEVPILGTRGLDEALQE